MTSTMRAQRFYSDTKKVVVEDVPIPEPGPGEVLIAVMAAFAGGLDPETLRGLMEPDTSGLATYFTPYRWVVQAVSALLWSFAYVMIVGASAHAYRAIALERGEHP